MKKESAYAQAGVDYTKIEPFKMAMIEVSKRTLRFPNKRDVFIDSGASHSHGGIYDYQGPYMHLWCKTMEGLGNKNWLAEWMYQHAETGRTYYEGIGIDTALMAVNDVIAQGAMPVVYADEVAAGNSEWFQDEGRAKDLAESFFQVCQRVGMALVQGESSTLKYLVNAKPPVNSAPSLSGCVTGIIAPKKRKITGQDLQEGDHILGAPSSGLHANGYSLVLQEGLKLKEQFLTPIPFLKNRTLGDEALIPTREYVTLIEALIKEEIKIHALVPGTGGGVSKVAFDKRPFTYEIKIWPSVPRICQYINDLGVSLKDCLTTFNWGVGYYIFVPWNHVDSAMHVAKRVGYDLIDLGIVKKGPRKVIFKPEDLTLPPPGD